MVVLYVGFGSKVRHKTFQCSVVYFEDCSYILQGLE